MKNIGELSQDEMTEYVKHPVRGQAVIDCIEDLGVRAFLSDTITNGIMVEDSQTD